MEYRDHPVDTFYRHARCPSCDAGNLIATGLGVPGMWQHKCDKCFIIENLDNKYPGVIYKPKAIEV